MVLFYRLSNVVEDIFYLQKTEKSTTFENFDDTQELEYHDWSYSSNNDTSESEDESNSLPGITSLKPYDFEPEIPYVEDETVMIENQNEKPSPRIGNVNWCTCGEYKPRETETESICCLDKNEVPDGYIEG